MPSHARTHAPSDTSRIATSTHNRAPLSGTAPHTRIPPRCQIDKIDRSPDERSGMRTLPIRDQISLCLADGRARSRSRRRHPGLLAPLPTQSAAYVPLPRILARKSPGSQTLRKNPAALLHPRLQILSRIRKRAFSILDIDIELHIMLLEKINKLR